MKKKLFIIIFLLGFAGALQAQQKNDWYYTSHTDEILPDAKAAYKAGDYDRAMSLSILHESLLGEDHKDAETVSELRANSKKCIGLVAELQEHIDNGDMWVAKKIADELKKLNPDDARIALAVEPEPEKTTTRPSVRQKSQTGGKKSQTEYTSKDLDYKDVSDDDYEPGTQFILKANLAFMGLGEGHVASAYPLGLTAGLYSIGGSIFGTEARIYTSFNKDWPSARVFGIDVNAAFTLTPWLCLTAGPGYFNCAYMTAEGKKTDPTHGLSMNVGANLILGHHFVIEIGGNYYNTVRVWSPATAHLSTGTVISYLDALQVFSAQFAPRISLGFAF